MLNVLGLSLLGVLGMDILGLTSLSLIESTVNLLCFMAHCNLAVDWVGRLEIGRIRCRWKGRRRSHSNKNMEVKTLKKIKSLIYYIISTNNLSNCISYSSFKLCSYRSKIIVYKQNSHSLIRSVMIILCNQ